MKRRAAWFAGVWIAAALVAGCGRQSSGTHHADDSADHGGGVVFKEGLGLVLNPDVRKALGLKTTEVQVRHLADNIRLLAQVFAVKPKVLASATVPADHQEHFTKHSFEDARLVRMHRTATGSSRLVDLIVEVERTPAPAVGDFVDLDFGAEPSRVLAVPHSALLDAAAGTFVYIANGEHFLRTPVKVGARSEEYVEITDGLRRGDVVVAMPVEQLWLAELRLTKGGGHSH